MRNSRVVEKYVRVAQDMNKDSPEPLLVCNGDDEWVRESPKLQLLWAVAGLQLSVCIKSGPKNEQW